MENELHYAGEGAQVRVKIAAAGSLAVIHVADDGPGFSAELLESGDDGPPGTPRVFHRFVKGSGSQGHGLGLAFVNAVAAAHGGRASARNGRDAGGAEILVELPLFGGRGEQPESAARAGIS